MDIRTIRLREAFYNSRLTQTEVCDKTGINKGAFSSYLSGRYFPKQMAVEKLSAVLNVSIPYLMGFDEIVHDKFADLSNNEQFLLNIFNDMNEEGQEALVNYANYLNSLNKYKKHCEPEPVEEDA